MSSAFIVGHSGKGGRALCRQLAAEKRFARVVLIGRRAVDTNEFGPGFECKVVDLDNLKAEDFQGFEQGFSALGSRPKDGREAFIKIDRDLVLKVAELAKQGGCRHFHLITSMGTSSTTGMFYLQIKYQSEQGVKALGFEQVSIYRPGWILYDRSENDCRTQTIQNLFKPFEWIAPSKITTPADVLVKAMSARTHVEGPDVTILETRDLLQWSKKSSQQ